jgi:integrase
MGGSMHFDKRAQRYFISIYWEGKRYRIYKNPVSGEPFWHKKSAEKHLMKLRTEVDEGTFQPKTWFPNNPLALDRYSAEWLKVIDVSANTLKEYSSSVNLIVKYFGNKDIRKIRHNDLVKFYKWIPRKSKGKYNVMSALKTMLRHAWRSEDIPKVPPFPKLSYKLPEITYLTFEEQERQLEAIPERDRPIFQFMMEYGCRPGEARALKWDCIKADEVIIKRAFSENELRDTTKTGRTRRYKITPYFETVLKDVSASKVKSMDGFVFIRDDGNPYTGKNLNKIWKAAGNITGIKIKMYNGLRHSLGSQLFDMGYGLSLVQDQLGHVDPKMTRRYAKRSKQVLSDALEARRGKIIELKKKSQ